MLIGIQNQAKFFFKRSQEIEEKSNIIEAYLGRVDEGPPPSQPKKFGYFHHYVCSP